LSMAVTQCCGGCVTLPPVNPPSSTSSSVLLRSSTSTSVGGTAEDRDMLESQAKSLRLAIERRRRVPGSNAGDKKSTTAIMSHYEQVLHDLEAGIAALPKVSPGSPAGPASAR
ncbi:unnamed protein product, partial [Polarella glacialis]